ncbi:MAG: hypothetical protein ACLFPQ_06700 [Candidatus Woesearchaeota archaeon]
MENLRRELPELTKKNMERLDNIDLRRIDTKILLDYAGQTSEFLKKGDIKSDFRKGLFRSDFLK